MFDHIKAYAGDPIFKIGEAYHADPREKKVNLTVGLYYDDEGKIPLLDTIQASEKTWAEQHQPRPYLPIEGLASYRSAVQKLVFGADSVALKEGRIATIQTLGGTGALKVGGDFLHVAFPNAEMWISDPAWDNHHAIFRGAGINTHSYRYYDKQTQGLDFEGLVEDISKLAPHSIVLLHPCCHNPTGVDLSQEQWLTLIPVLREKQLIAFMDMAYQGFGQGIEEDSFAIRAMEKAGLTFFVANSFSKNFSYYAERCGALSVVCASADEAHRVLGQLKAAVRRIYSNPPIHGGQAIAGVLNNPALYAQWEVEVAAMRDRIAAMRQAAHEKLKLKAPHYDSSYFVKQKGMFCYTGLSSQQLQRLRDEFGVYIIDSGRISVPGLNHDNIDYFVEAVAAVVNSDVTEAA